jgi:uncharacterized protein YbjT (DUF2867 family)
MRGITLITGATGNVGSEVIRHLLSSGVRVRAAVTNPALARIEGSEAVEWVRFDFNDTSTHAPVLEGVEKIFLVRPPALSELSQGMYPFLDLVKAAGVRQVVFLSIMGVERNPLSPHFKIERYLRDEDIPFTSLRPSFFMQNLSTTHCADIRDEDQICVPAGNGRTSFIDARDIAEIAAKMLLRDGHVDRAYTLTGSEALDYDEVAAILSRELGRRIRYSKPSAHQFHQHMREQGWKDDFVSVVGMIYFVVRMGWAQGITPDAQLLLGRPPRRLQEYVHDYAACWARPTHARLEDAGMALT